MASWLYNSGPSFRSFIARTRLHICLQRIQQLNWPLKGACLSISRRDCKYSRSYSSVTPCYQLFHSGKSREGTRFVFLQEHDIPDVDCSCTIASAASTLLSMRFSKYSACHRFQKWLRTTLRYFILLVKCLRVRSTSSSSGSSPQQIPSGKLKILFPVRKWASVSGSCRSSGDTYVRGRELITISTSIREVSSSSYESGSAKNLPQTPFCLANHSLNYAAPPGGSLNIKLPFNSQTRQVFLDFPRLHSGLNGLIGSLKCLGVV